MPPTVDVTEREVTVFYVYLGPRHGLALATTSSVSPVRSEVETVPVIGVLLGCLIGAAVALLWALYAH